ncbi:hypothetical protein LIER_42408 [Lithospermum erythrorhizon]|uniref:Retrotransposon gag domain-containing protein n=1 Tax=Lithospermum erythrorhizon TaxID=34254 RepID=A0AAV3RQZ9_LITER
MHLRFLRQLKEGQRDVITYYNEMVTLWEELDQSHKDVWENMNDHVCQQQREENDCVFMFLAGVNQKLDEVKGRIPGRRPLPSIREVFSEVRSEENRWKIMYHTQTDNNSEQTALTVRGNDLTEEKKKKPWCDVCKKFWHTKETCWKIHGKPPGWKPKTDRALHTISETSQDQQIKSGAAIITQKQIEQLLKMLHSSNSSDKLSCLFAQNGSGLMGDDWQC